MSTTEEFDKDYDHSEALAMLPPEVAALVEVEVLVLRYISRNTKIAWKQPANGVPLSRYRIAAVTP